MRAHTSQLITNLLLAFLLVAVSPCIAAEAQPADTLRAQGAVQAKAQDHPPAKDLPATPGISLRTNLVWDGFAEPNIGVEVPVGEHVTVGGNAGLKAWPRWLAWDWDNKDNTTHWRNFAVVPEVRYYLNEIYQGWFAGADFIYTHYNVGNVQTPFHMYPEAENYRVQGSYWAGGVFAGYAWWPWQHWRLELEAGIAAGLAAYDRYDCPHCGTKLAEVRTPALVPKLAVNVAWNPVSRDEAAERAQRRIQAVPVISGTDTITVLTPPVAFVVHLKDVPAPETAGDSLSKDNPWVIPIEKYRPLGYLTRSARDSVLTVQYELDSEELVRDFPALTHRNGKVMDRIAEAVGIIRDDPRTAELLVSVVGLASFEGPQERNDTLAIRRARAVAQALSDSTGVSRNCFETISKGEGWDWFKAHLETIPDGYKSLTAEDIQKLLEIIETEADADLRERKIKADKPLYKKVKDHLLADQRNAGYIRVYYGAAPDPATEKLNGPIQALLKAKRYHDAVRAVEADPAVQERVMADAEAMNAYGIALYFTALDNQDEQQEQQALDLLRQAARQGSQPAKENLKGTEIYGPARKEYQAWLEAMKDNN